MQDNKYSELANKGWQEMEAVLDKEMPVRRRRLFPFLLFLGLVSVSAVTGMVYTINHSPILDQEPSRQKLPMINTAEIESNEMSQDVATKDLEVNNDLRNKEYQSPSAEIAQKTTEQIAFDEAKHLPTQTLERNKSSDQSTQSQDSDGKRSIVSIPSETGLIKKEQDSYKNEAGTTLVENISNKQMRLNLTDMQLLPLDSEIRLFDIANFSEVGIELPMTISRIIKPFNFSLIAGINIPVYGKMSGFEAGIGVSKDLSRRWSLAGDLLFTTTRFRYGQRAVEYAINTADVPINTAGEEARDPSVGLFEESGILEPSLFNQAVEGVSRLDYISVPLLIRYKIARRHQLGMGIQYSYLLSSSNILIQQNQELSFGADRTENSISKKVLNAQSLSFAGNYNFLISRRFEIATKLNYGFSPIFNTTDRIEKNRIFNLTLALRYNL